MLSIKVLSTFSCWWLDRIYTTFHAKVFPLCFQKKCGFTSKNARCLHGNTKMIENAVVWTRWPVVCDVSPTYSSAELRKQTEQNGNHTWQNGEFCLDRQWSQLNTLCRRSCTIVAIQCIWQLEWQRNTQRHVTSVLSLKRLSCISEKLHSGGLFQMLSL